MRLLGEKLQIEPWVTTILVKWEGEAELAEELRGSMQNGRRIFRTVWGTETERRKFREGRSKGLCWQSSDWEPVLPLQGMQVQYLVRELRSCMPCGQKILIIKIKLSLKRKNFLINNLSLPPLSFHSPRWKKNSTFPSFIILASFYFFTQKEKGAQIAAITLHLVFILLGGQQFWVRRSTLSILWGFWRSVQRCLAAEDGC